MRTDRQPGITTTRSGGICTYRGHRDLPAVREHVRAKRAAMLAARLAAKRA